MVYQLKIEIHLILQTNRIRKGTLLIDKAVKRLIHSRFRIDLDYLKYKKLEVS